SWTQLLMTARMGLDTSTRAMVSRAIGAKDIKLANHVALQSFLLGGGMTLVLSTLAVIFTEWLLHLLGVSDRVIAEGANYVRVQFLATLSLSFLFTSTAILQASGDAVTPMKAQVVTRVLHITLAPLLVFGPGFLPSLGLPGTALANFVAQAVGASMNLYVLFTGGSRIQLTLRGFRVDLPLLWRLTVIGAPASATNMERSVANLIVVGLISPFGDLILAAYSIVQRVQMFINLGSSGIGQASGTLVGQNLGATQEGRARTTVWWAVGFSLAANVLVGAVILLFPAALLSIFSRDGNLLEVGAVWLQIQVIGFIIAGGNVVFIQTFNGAGDTVIPLVATFASMWAIELPVAVLLSGVGQNWSILGLGFSIPTIGTLGVLGIAWSIVVAQSFRFSLYLPYFLWGPWHKKKVI
ncbi:MAG: MATE family efflux transporter, partial [Dehalococcoidia bacterium]|nr:MATE family efflux transporter [Dehalococcoidia bacterium]